MDVKQACYGSMDVKQACYESMDIKQACYGSMDVKQACYGSMDVKQACYGSMDVKPVALKKNPRRMATKLARSWITWSMKREGSGVPGNNYLLWTAIGVFTLPFLMHAAP